MKRATLTETKNNLSALIDRVRHGETVLILDRGRPVARIESVVSGDDPGEGRLERLERQGMVSRGKGEHPSRLVLEDPPPRPAGGASGVASLIAERRDSR